MSNGLSEILVGHINFWQRIETLGLAEFYVPIYQKTGTTLSTEIAEALDASQMSESTMEMVENGSSTTLYLVRQLFEAMQIAKCPDFYLTWGLHTDDTPQERIDYFFDLFKHGRAEVIDEYVLLVRPLASNPTASLHLDDIETARKKYLALESELSKTRLSEIAQRFLSPSTFLLPSTIKAVSPQQLKR